MSTSGYAAARYDFTGSVAIVTGGASGIGAEVARQLDESGARVAIWDMAEQANNEFMMKKNDFQKAGGALEGGADQRTRKRSPTL